MDARPKHYITMPGKLKVIYGEKGMGCWLQCEIFRPPSLEGRSVDVYFSAEDVTQMLLFMRDVAQNDRR